jgi:dynein heavy chain 1
LSIIIGYAGRSNLPDNLKTLFRAVAMVKPDSKLISQVMLYSQGIVSAQQLSDKVVKLFHLCESRMSHQSHYDFSLRALKTLLISAGGSKRKIMESSESSTDHDILSTETSVLVKTACDNVLPKLVTEDVTVFSSILSEVFPGSSVYQMEDATLKEQLECICKKMHYVTGDNWLQKILQLRQVLEMRHGVMLVGPSGVGKSSALKVLVQGLEKIEGTRGEVYIIDPKAVDKFSLYGVLDGTTMEWTDGIFTSILRKIVANQKGEADRRHWIVFDGEVDPVWAENLNSVLDDNKLLTLPSGERLEIPNNVRILLEVDSLEQATAATVSRCGMVWFNDDTLSLDMCLEHLYNSLQNKDISGDGRGIPAAQVSFLESIKSMLLLEDGSSLVYDAVEFAMMQDHIMLPTRERLLASFKALLIQGLQQAIDYDENHPDFPMSGEHLSNYAKRWTLHSLLWSLAGSTSWAVRHKLSDMLLRSSGAMLPSDDNKSLADYRIRVEDGEYELWSDSVPRMEIESHKVVSSDVVVTTTDTVRHSDVLYAWLSSRMPLILCGPPGSGKTMTLTAVLQSIQGIVMANLNFSSKTTPEIILKTFSQYCVYSRKGKDIVLEPSDSLGSQTWLVVFCDEINLPENDTYGTQRVITFMRQLVEQGGFWREDNQWVKINRIQFVGACNPPTDAGRVEMSPRFLRHAPLILVDFPARDSLHQIYGTFNGGIMKLFPNLKGETTALTEAMVEFYCEIQSKFTPDMQPQYFFSPRELSRWVRGIYESVAEMESLTREELVRIWAHEALRLFCDRLVEPSEREWCENLVDSVAKTYFAGVDHNDALSRPLFYSTWLSKDTRRVTREELKDFLSARLRVFYEEELDVPLVVFDEVLEHILRVSILFYIMNVSLGMWMQISHFISLY